MSERRRRFLPGVGVSRPQAAGEQGLDASDASAAIAEAQPALRQLFRTQEPVVVLPTSPGILREIALRAAVEQRVLVLVAGPDSAALADTAEALGMEVIRAMVHPGRTLEPEQLARFLSGPPVDAVAMVHSETGTGALAPLMDLARVVHGHSEVLLFVDASGSLGASELLMDEWGLDLVLASTEGALGLSGGLALAAASGRLIARARSQRDRGRELDFVAHHAAAQTGSALTPALPGLASGLATQVKYVVETEGLEARWARHARLRETVERWVAARPDVSFLAPAERRSATVSCLVLPPERPARLVVEQLAREGWTVAPGVEPEADRLLRIGHMGERQVEELEELLTALGRALGQ